MNYYEVKAFIIGKLEKELSEKLTYHGLHHTLDVLEVTEELCQLENIGEEDSILLKTAALFHDSGFTISNKEHEKLGCQIAQEHLPHFSYTPLQIQQICGMIMATKVPQTPKTFLEKILCDADLDYLGRDDFYSIGGTLFEELKAFGVLQTEEQWNRLQIKFLAAHHFWTETTIDRRQVRKQLYLKELKTLVATY